MKKIILPSICFAVLSTPAFAKVIHAAENDTPVAEINEITTTQYVKVGSGSHLNLRTSATTKSTVLAKLKDGTEVTIYSEKDGWAKVKAAGKEGYVSTGYLSKTKPSTASTTATPAPKLTPAPTITTEYVKVGSSTYLNLRTSATTKSTVLAKLKDGTKVTIYSEKDGWAKVKAAGKEGYVSTAYLSKTKPSTPSTPAPTAPAPTIQYVDVDKGSNLNMRNKPSTNASIIIKLARGHEVTVISEENGWSQIKAYGKEGYVSSEYLSTVKPGANQDSDSTSESNPVVPNPTIPEPATPEPATPEPAKLEPVIPETDAGDDFENDQSSNEQETDKTPETETLSKYVDINLGSNLNMRSEPSTKATIITKLAPGTVVTIYSEENGWARVTANGQTGYVSTQYLIDKIEDKPSSPNQKINIQYEEYDISLADLTNIQMKANPQTDTKYTTYIREDALLINDKTNPTSGIVQGSTWNIRGGAGTDYWVVGKVNSGEKVQIKSTTKGTDGYDWYEIDYNKAWVNASPDDVAYHLDPNNFIDDSVTSLQFLKLSEATNLDQFEVNERILAGKGVLAGHAATFIAAGEKHGVNDIYLISHALLETGNGTSQLAKGVEIYGKTVYNMFGIGAYDGSAVTSGAKFAYDAGWFSPVDAIVGGAKFISQGYINSGQDTLYKMRWNPQDSVANGVATHQYATDIGWATKQVKQVYNLYSLLDSYKIKLQIPFYKE
ncbi:SH3 domain-containing protein [Bacillus sp. V3B]|uniref:SH3 domain-containing protein n=1 Tax=Bacillus sp. V3B TaxID=2804915 RepID=UPI00210E0411|nr:SH3 domain-containing protein [Bacillus sp. V3B]MCQ6277102.1 SH3 domain-containing protein [Bacillus sp. V3B]